MKESELQKAIINYLTLQGNLGRCLFLRNNTFAGFIQRRDGSKGYIKNATIKGSPDIMLFLPKGNTIFLEIKSDKGKLSPAQEEFKERAEALGFSYLVVRSLDDIILYFENN